MQTTDATPQPSPPFFHTALDFVLKRLRFAGRVMEAGCERVTCSILRQKTDLVEALLGTFGIVRAYLSLSTDAKGGPVAPFLATGLAQLQIRPSLWFWALTIYGTATLIALVHGQIHNNSLKMRSAIHLIGALFQVVIAVAVYYSPQAPAASLSYWLTAMWAWIIAIILIVRHEKRKYDALNGIHDRRGERGEY